MEKKFAEWLSNSILFTTRATPENAFYEGIRVERERIIELVLNAEITVDVDKNTTQRDLDAMGFAEHKFRHMIVALIKGEQK